MLCDARARPSDVSATLQGARFTHSLHSLRAAGMSDESGRAMKPRAAGYTAHVLRVAEARARARLLLRFRLRFAPQRGPARLSSPKLGAVLQGASVLALKMERRRLYTHSMHMHAHNEP